MIDEKEIKVLQSQIKRITALRYIEESLDLMKEIVEGDNTISAETKRKFMIVYIQTLLHVSQQISNEANIKPKFGLRKRLRRIFGKK